MTIRPARYDDWRALVDLHDRCSDRTRYLRFFTAHPRLPVEDAIHLVTVDQQDRDALVVLHRGRMVAIGGWDRQRDDSAEVAFLVDDAFQGRGVGTLLLEHLAVRARNHGCHRLDVTVLATNHQMLDVVARAGFHSKSATGHGEVDVHLDLDDIESVEPLVRDREHQADVASMTRLLRPRSVAVISDDLGADDAGREVLAGLREYHGKVHVVDPVGGSWAGATTHLGVDDLPAGVDLALLTVPADELTATVEACAAAGVLTVALLARADEVRPSDRSAGSDDLRRIARDGGMRLVGPGSVGLLHPSIGVHALLGGPPVEAGPVGLLTQSGAVARALITELAERSIGVSTALTVGAKADVSGNDLLQYWEADPATEVALLHLESFGNPHKFARLARAVGRTRPIVALRSGPIHDSRGSVTEPSARRSDAGELFQQLGVIDVATVDEMVDIAQLLVSQPRPRGRRIAVVADTRGLGVLAADACTDAGLAVVRVGAADAGRGSGPISVVDDEPGALAGEIDTAMTCADADAVLVVLDRLRPTTVLGGRSYDHPKPLVGMCSERPVADVAAGRERDGGIAWFESVRAAAVAVERAAAYDRWVRRPDDQSTCPPGVDRHRARALVDADVELPAPTGWMGYEEVAALLDSYSIDHLSASPASARADAVAAATRVGFPVQLTCLDGDARRVAPSLGPLRSADEIAAGWDAIIDRVGPAALPLAVTHGSPDGTDLELRVEHHPQVGPVLSVDLDRGWPGGPIRRVLPLSDLDCAGLARAVVRHAPDRARAIHVGALQDLFARVSAMLDDNPEITDLAFHPLVAGARSTPVVASIRLRRGADPWDDLTRHLRRSAR